MSLRDTAATLAPLRLIDRVSNYANEFADSCTQKGCYKSYDPTLMLSDSRLAKLDDTSNPEKPPMRHFGHSEALSTKLCYIV